MALEAVSPTGPDRRALTRELDGLIGVLSQMLAAMSDLAKVETE
jgi:hypothetical protein